MYNFSFQVSSILLGFPRQHPSILYWNRNPHAHTPISITLPKLGTPPSRLSGVVETQRGLIP